MTTMSPQEINRRYAQLVLHCGWGGPKNIKDKPVNLLFAAPAYDLALAIAEAAYKDGSAARVDFTLNSMPLDKLHVDNASKQRLTEIPATWSDRWNDLVKVKGATLRIEGVDQPLALASCNAKRVSAFNAARIKARDKFYSKGLHTNHTPWCIVPYATQDWGKMVFPDMGPEQARLELERHFINILGLQHDDFISRWWARGRAIAARSRYLDELQIDYLHFEGPGTDLRVYLHELARFGGGMHAGGAANRPFFANIPTFENYTTPDARHTEGQVQFTRPVLINGELVDGIKATFRKGKVVAFSATRGEKTFASMLSTDKGAKYLGEVALVGIDDSPIFQSGVIFKNTLLDENAACHIAFGRAYPDRLEGGLRMNAKRKAACGCNESLEHRDCMISDAKTTVTAVRRDGSSVILIQDGAWRI